MSEHSVTETGHQAALQSEDDKKTIHYEKVREDIRGEIKLRIGMRGRLATYMVALLALVCAVAFADGEYGQALLVVPFLSVFFTTQILYSYRKHDVLAKYLREVIEPALAKLHRIDPSREWHTYGYKTARSGFMRGFLIGVMWVVSAGSMIFLWFQTESDFRLTFYIFAGVYALVMLSITLVFMGDSTVRRKGRHKGAVHQAATGAYLS
jgi:hypothetical protein